MASVPESGTPAFKISMLIYDTRYRSITIQIIVLVAVLVTFGWLANNAIQNLERLGKDFDFGFLSQPAGYDINQRLLDYNSQNSHARAAILGVLNTLLIAFLGCVAATIIGVIAGVLRLSKNWIVARIMTVYVETFRNIPVLIWILITMAVVTEALPAPRDFRGVDPSATMLLWDSVAITNRGIYVPAPVFEAGSFVVVIVFLLSLVGIFGFRRYARQRQDATGEILPVFPITVAIFFVPSLLIYFVTGMPISLELPYLKGFNFADGVYMRNSLIALWLALSLYTGSFIAENVRAGIIAVSKGQTEAAAALGLRSNRIMSLVVLPQALRIIIPPLISQYLNLTKNSSLAIAVGYMDVTGTLGGITLNQTGREMETILLLMLFYLVISLTISAVMNWYNSRVKLKGR